MGRSFLSALCLTVLVLCCACQRAPATPSQPEPTYPQTFEELVEEAESRAKAQEQEQSPDFTALAGVYRGELPEVTADYQPTLTLTADGNFVFHANLLSAMGDLTGSFTTTQTTLRLTVSSNGLAGFAGESIHTLVFDMLPDNTLRLAYTEPISPIGATNDGDLFYREPG